MMRHASLLTCGLLACVLALALGCRRVDEPTLESVVAQIVKAQGGEKLKTIKSIKKSGSLLSYMSYKGRETVALVHFAVRPDKVRQEISLGRAKIVQAYDGMTAWRINPFDGSFKPKIISKNQVDELTRLLYWVGSLDLDIPFVDSAEKGYKLELMADEELDGKPVHVVKVTDRRGKVETYYADARSGLILKIQGREKVDDTETEVETLFSDYKEVNGIMTAHTIGRFALGHQLLQVMFRLVEYDVTVDDSLFEMPEVSRPKVEYDEYDYDEEH
ncbi:hypothetical protein [Chloracidobacterium aggregatum]|uniref:hypothetical protein n=1 Tax=Chloracidobacterium aggregatum TaxID=2851959 RepID=UPI001B8CF2BB|nr:hypothetical protein [Chloracidobacterium aggregatum]QUV86169.1 hypothetical protein J8C03_15415 [Chloracidobacterium sp. 2]QUV89385.1 hypothetical protein J8C07_11885 [Chloracidobacterium sp. S]QUV98294.1 hypothetical protein J8C00_14985 [Chloracidobacterium sp. E]